MTQTEQAVIAAAANLYYNQYHEGGAKKADWGILYRTLQDIHAFDSKCSDCGQFYNVKWVGTTCSDCDGTIVKVA